MEEIKTTERLSKILRIGGYLIVGGALVGFSVGIYLLFNRPLFSFFISISQFEAVSYFLGVFIPSFVILATIGYLFAATLRPRKTDLPNVGSLCVLSLLCMVFSALSVFYFISFIGGFAILIVLIKAYTKPAFKTLSKKEAFFLVEISAMLVGSSSLLFLLMWLLSNVFRTYAMGYVGYSPFALFLVGVLSSLMFLLIPLLGSIGTNAGFCGALGLIMTVLSYLFVVQNRYSFFNASASIGVFMLVFGFVSALVGELLYFWIFFSEPAASTIQTSSLLYHGTYCPYCGKPRVATFQDLCSRCGRDLMWTPYAPFCSSCGKLVRLYAQTCPHCQEDIRNKRIYFNLTETEEQAAANKLILGSTKKESRRMKGWLRISRVLQMVGRPLWGSVNRFFNVISEFLSFTLKDVVFVIILSYLLGFVSFIAYVRVEPLRLATFDMFVSSYGFPLGWLQVATLPPFLVYDVVILWIPLALDCMLYFLASLALVYGTTRLRR